MSALIIEIDTVLADPGVREDTGKMLEILKGLGVKLGAISVTGDHRALVELIEAGFGGHFDWKDCKDSPDRDMLSPLNGILGHLGVNAAETAFVGDAAGIRLAVDAGLGTTIGVSHAIRDIARLRAAGAEVVVPNIIDVFDVVQ